MVGEGWTTSNIVGALSEMGMTPEVGEITPGDPVRIIGAQDPVTKYGFAVIYMDEPVGGANHFSLLTMIPAPNLSEQDAAAIDQRLAMATAFLEDNFLWIYAELDTSARFSKERFRTQTTFYLNDMRMALELFVSSSRMSFTAAKAFKSSLARRGNTDAVIRSLKNEQFFEAEAHERPAPETREVQSFTAEACSRCNGSGKKLFRPCKACFGSGEVRS